LRLRGWAAKQKMSSLTLHVASIIHRFDEKYHDWAWGIRTGGWIPSESLGSEQDWLGYCPTPYSVLRSVFKALPPAVRGGAFLDYGCGMGRALIAACREGFQKVIGVERSPTLCTMARRNVRQFPAEVVEGDAALYPVPDNVSVFFFFNPFRGGTLAAVLDRIGDSVIEKDRPAVMAVYMRKYFEEIVEGRPWIRRNGVRLCYFPKGSWSLYSFDRDALVNSRADARRETSAGISDGRAT
jgi:SAM-dependent methyltransferase